MKKRYLIVGGITFIGKVGSCYILNPGVFALPAVIDKILLFVSPFLLSAGDKITPAVENIIFSEQIRAGAIHTLDSVKRQEARKAKRVAQQSVKKAAEKVSQSCLQWGQSLALVVLRPLTNYWLNAKTITNITVVVSQPSFNFYQFYQKYYSVRTALVSAGIAVSLLSESQKILSDFWQNNRQEFLAKQEVALSQDKVKNFLTQDIYPKLLNDPLSLELFLRGKDQLHLLIIEYALIFKNYEEATLLIRSLFQKELSMVSTEQFLFEKYNELGKPDTWPKTIVTGLKGGRNQISFPSIFFPKKEEQLNVQAEGALATLGIYIARQYKEMFI